MFRLYDHSAFKKDSLVGEAVLELYGILVKHDGRLQRLTMSLDLKSSGNDGHHHSRKDSHKSSQQSNSDNSNSSNLNNNNNVPQKSGELIIILDGLTIDMTSIPVASPPVGVSVIPSAYDPLIAAAVVANGEGPAAGALLGGVATSQGTSH